MTVRNGLFSSESVSEGHPDKLADRISDAVLDEFLRLEPTARVACETLLADQCVVVAGEFKTRDPDVFRQVRERAVSIVAGVLRDAGYRDGSTGIDPERCEIQVRFNGGAYSSITSGTASSAFTLGYGLSTIDLLVTAQDATTTKAYTLNVTRNAPALIAATYNAATDIPPQLVVRMPLLEPRGSKDGDARSDEVQRPEPADEITDGAQHQPQLASPRVRPFEPHAVRVPQSSVLSAHTDILTGFRPGGGGYPRRRGFSRSSAE